MATYVLVHGTGSGGWLWDPVTRLLRDAGHVVHTPTLVGVGERTGEGGPETNLTTHAQQIVALIEEQAAEVVVLVGFSYGGVVVESVAGVIPERIGELILVDAVTPVEGKSILDAFPSAVADQLRAATEAGGEGWKLPPLPLDLVGGIGAVERGVDPDEVERVLNERRGSHPIGTFEEVFTREASSVERVPRRYIIGTDKPSGGRDRALASARRLREDGWTVDELPTGHFAMRSMPKALTSLLLRDQASS
jgi:pimeloyl-ACP methyl ester carboxylesterase